MDDLLHLLFVYGLDAMSVCLCDLCRMLMPPSSYTHRCLTCQTVMSNQRKPCATTNSRRCCTTFSRPRPAVEVSRNDRHPSYDRRSWTWRPVLTNWTRPAIKRSNITHIHTLTYNWYYQPALVSFLKNRTTSQPLIPIFLEAWVYVQFRFMCCYRISFVISLS